MNLYKSILGIAAAGLLVISSMGAAVAGPFETANAYYGNKYGVPDFTFTKSEFGNTNLGRLVHLGAEVVVETIAGAAVVYNPATGEVQVWGSVGGYSDGIAAKEYAEGSGCFGTFGTAVVVGTNPDNNVWCIPGSMIGSASTAPTPVLLGTIAPTARDCSFDAASDGIDVHSC